MKKNEFMAIEVKGMKKNDMLSALRDMPKAVKDTNLLDRVKYTLAQADKSLAKVTNADLSDLIREAQELLTSSSAAPRPAEALKKPSKGSKKPDTKAKSDEDDEEEPEKPAEKSAKSKGKKKLGMKTAPQKVNKSGYLPVASMFPEEVEFDTDDGATTLVRAHEKFHTVQELREALENGDELYIATYWSARHIKQYKYGEQYRVQAPKSFPDDLDILSVVVCCDTVDRVYAMSAYTEAMAVFDGDDFEPVEDEDPSDNSKFTVRVSNGLEFEVYTTK